MTETVVAEGQVKFRDGKKWKTRFVVLQKPSPVADCLSLLVFKEKKKKKGSGHKERLAVTLEGICGVEPGPGYDGVSYTLSILCLAHTLVLGFNSRDALLAWDARVCYSLGEVHRFGIAVEPGTKLESGPASLHLCSGLLVLAKGLPPAVAGHWKLSALRRYGAVPNGFVFEGGTRCGAWAGVFYLSCSEGEQISFLFDCMVRGVAPGRARRGLGPPPPELNTDPALTEERLSHEASELEKRLSRLSQCSLASSTASTYSCSTSVAGDDRSSISSSSSSHSDTSHTARLPFWVDPLARSRISCDTASSASTLKPLTCSDDQLYASGGPEPRPSSAHIHTRGLHDSGRQSSLDSGIGIATGSQSSYSGSVSSCTGSLDMASQGGGEEFTSIATLAAPTPSSPSSVPPPSSPPPPPLPPSLPFKPEPSSATSSCAYASKPSACSSRRHSDEYQIPNLLRLWYDTPRSLLQPKAQEGKSERGRNSWCNGGGGRSQERGSSDSLTGLSAQHQAAMQRSLSWDSEREPSVDREQSSTPRPGLDYGKTQCGPEVDNYVTPEQLQVAKGRASSEAALGASEARDDGGAVGRKLWALKRLLSSRPPSAPPPLPVPRPASCGVFQLPLDSRLHSGGSVNYVNVPISTLLAKANRELLTEPTRQEPSSAPVLGVHTAVGEEGSIRYAHLHTAAMETAQRVGAEHVQGREDRLTQLESRRRGPPR